MENNSVTFLIILLKFFIRELSLQQVIANCKVQLFVDIPGFPGGNRVHQRFFANAVMPLDKVVAPEQIKTGVLLVDGRQVLGLDQLTRVVIDGTSILKIQSGLQACY